MSSIRQYLRKLKFKKDFAKVRREKKTILFEKARTVGILYIVGDEADYLKVTSFANMLVTDKKEVRMLGLIKFKDIPHYCYPKIYYDYITLKQKNWLGVPFGPKIKEFTNSSFDLLINIDITGNETLLYAVGVSNAKFKIGKAGPFASSVYDLLIDIPESVGRDYFIEQSLQYLKMITPS